VRMDCSVIGGGSRGRVSNKQQTVPLYGANELVPGTYSDLCPESHCKATLDLE
jgi:hypothetical protein